MGRPRNKYRDYLLYLILRLLAGGARLVPVRVLYAFCGALAGAYYRLGKKHRERCLEHIRASYPDWTPEQCDRVAKASIRNLSYLGLEVMLTPVYITPQRWRRHIELNNLREVLRLLLEHKTGFVFVTGHHGNFEVLGYTMATLGFPSVAVARPLDNEYINDWVMGVRERTGQSILYKKGATMSMDEILDARGSVAFIADQDAGRKGAFVQFFGRPASTYKTPALMAMQHQVPVIVGTGERLGRGFRFRINIERVICPSDWADQPDPLMWITQEYTTALETAIRRNPEQYLWVHRRWKHQPTRDI